jgi:hypothetical protein
MATPTQPTGHPDTARVDITRDHEVRYWTKRFACTENQLRAAVAAVGPMVIDIWRHLAAG